MKIKRNYSVGLIYPVNSFFSAGPVFAEFNQIKTIGSELIGKLIFL
jgi:hypothetical protein